MWHCLRWCGLGNTAFMGYPMIEARRGAPGLSLAPMLCWALGSLSGVTELVPWVCRRRPCRRGSRRRSWPINTLL